jgi:O-Antigen ligase
MTIVPPTPIPLAAGALCAYVVLMPFMSALAPSEWLPLPLLLLLLALPWLLRRRDGPSLGQALARDTGFLLAFALGLVGILWAPLPVGAKHLNYSAAVVVSYGLFFVAVRAWLHHPAVTLQWIGVCAHRSLTLLSLAIALEFVLASYFGIFFADLVPFAHADLNVANLVSDAFKRPRAFAQEPGFTALAFECLWPLTLLAPRSPWRHLLYLLGFALLASAAAMLAFAFAGAVVWLAHRRNLRSLLIVALGAGLLAALAAFTETGAEVMWAVLGRKLDLGAAADDVVTGDAVTVVDRVSTYLIGWQLLQDHPFGIGWGSLGQAFATQLALPEIGGLRGSGMLSLYLDVAVAAGWLGLACLLAFVGRRVLAVLRSNDPRAAAVAMGLLAVAFHHALITEFQFPFFWFALAMADRFAADQEAARHAVEPQVPVGYSERVDA